MSKQAKNTIYVILALLIIIVGWNVLAHAYVKHFHNDVKRKPTKYAYDISSGVINPVMIITDLKYKQDLIEYYNKIYSGEPTPVFNFPLKSILPKQPVYVIGATPDSQLLEVVLYLTDNMDGNYLRGFMDTRTLHKLPAPDSLWEKKARVKYNINEVYYWDSIQSVK